jgi:chromosome segregation ATPase
VTDDDDDPLAARLAAVERAVTDGEALDLSEAAAVQRQLDDVADDLETLTDRVDALEATVQSLHGYVGEIEHVNERVERRADAARAAVERLDDQPTARPPARSTPPTEEGSHAGADGDGDEPADDTATTDEAGSVLDRLRSSL